MDVSYSYLTVLYDRIFSVRRYGLANRIRPKLNSGEFGEKIRLRFGQKYFNKKQRERMANYLLTQQVKH